MLFQQAYASLIAQLADMPKFLERTFAGVPTEMLHRKPVDDPSPLLEHLWHIRDCDPDLYGARIDLVLADERPVLHAIDVNAWVPARGYMMRKGEDAIHEFARVRGNLIAKLDPLDEASLSRVGLHFSGVEMSAMSIVEQLAAHDRDHRWRIASIFRSFAVSR